jgi:hypothetical protein
MTDIQTTPTDAARPAGLPDKFWDAGAEQVRLDALIASYNALEKKLSSSIPSPDTPEGKARMMQALGVPETPDGYTVDVSHGLFEADPEINAQLHGLGCTPVQVQAVYDLAAQRMVPMIVQVANEYKADREVQRLADAFGGPDRWAEVSRQLLAFGRKALPPDVLASLASSYDGVMALYRMMQNGAVPSMADAGAAPGMSEQDLQAMMRDPRYWRDRDPSFVAQVTDGFRKMYG